jgi:hypothetical protein
LSGEPGHGGRDREQRHEYDERQRLVAEPVTLQHERHDPNRQRRLGDHHRPEIFECAGAKPKAINRRTAGRERAVERTGEIAAGVEEQEGESVPQRGNQ